MELLMADRMRAHKLATVAQAVASSRPRWDLANLLTLEGQEPDYMVLHDSWELLVELAGRTERLWTRFLKDQPEQEAWPIEI
jgi:hypothetical protein